jgi:hypothetical protein
MVGLIAMFLHEGRSHIRLALVVFSGLFANTLLPLAVSAQSTEPKPSLASIQVRLFQNKTGTLSENVLGETAKDLRNSVSGPDSTNAALVVVEVTGPPRAVFNGFFGKKSLFHVRVVAKEKKTNSLLNQSQTIPALGENGKVYLGFWIIPNGCEPVHLVASIPDVSPVSSLSAELNFSCGE